LAYDTSRGFWDWQEVLKPGTVRAVPSGLNEFQVFRLFKCAVKDDDSLFDAMVERLYGAMKDFDAERAEHAVELVVDRDATAASKFGALLEELLPRRHSNLAA
jgi:hypothetical protein